MRHLNLELEKLEKRIAPGLALPVPLWGTGDCGCGTGGTHQTGASNGSKSNNSGSKAASGGSK